MSTWVSDARRLHIRPRQGVLGFALALAAGYAICPAIASANGNAGVLFGVTLTIGVPGWMALAALGLRDRFGAAAALGLVPAAGVAMWIAPLALAFAFGLPLGAAVILVFAASVALFAVSPRDARPTSGLLAAGAAGLASAAAVAAWPPALTGDSVFHAGRVRKMIALDRLSLSDVSAYLHGQPHAGYAFPLLHAAEAGAISLAGVDPARGYTQLAPWFAFFVPVLGYGAGKAIAGHAAGLAAAAFAFWNAFSPGVWPLSLTSVQQPPDFTILLVLPAGLMLAAELRKTPGDRVLSAGIVVLTALAAIVHPTYVIPLLAMLTAYAMFRHIGWRTVAACWGAAIAVFAWIYDVALAGASSTSYHRAYASGVGGHPLYISGHSVLDAQFPVALAALALVPLLILYGRRSISAIFMLGALALTSFPGIVTLLTATIGFAQTRRLWIAIPWMFVTAEVVTRVAAAASRRGLVAVTAGCAVLSVASWPGSPVWRTSTTPLTVIVSVAAVAVAMYLLVRHGAALRRLPPPPAATGRVLALTLAILAGPVLAFGHEVAHTGRPPFSGALLSHIRGSGTGAFPVVLGPLPTSYQLSGYADAYVVAVPKPRMLAEPKIMPALRRAAVRDFYRPGATSAERRRIARAYDVDYVLVDATALREVRALSHTAWLHRVFTDPAGSPAARRFVLFRTDTNR
jgi:hypothetical protein